MDPAQTQYIDVLYIPGKTMYGTLPARLEWKPDNTITLTTVEGTAEAPLYKQVLNTPVAKIQKISSMLDEIKIITETSKVRMSVAQYSTPAVAAGGIAGVAVGYGMYKKTGADIWLQRFKDNGVHVSRLGYGAIFGIALGVAVAIIAVAFGIFLIIEK